MSPTDGGDGLKRRAGGIEDEYWYEFFFIYTFTPWLRTNKATRSYPWRNSQQRYGRQAMEQTHERLDF